MSASKANGRASDTLEEKGMPSAVVNRPSDAVTAMEGTNSITFNLAANTGHPLSPPFQPANPSHVYGANDGLIHTGQAYSPTQLAFQPPAAGVSHHFTGHLFAIGSNSPVGASTSKPLAYASALSTGDGSQCFSNPLSDISAQLPPELTFHGSNSLGTFLHLDPSSSTELDQAFDPSSIDKEISQGPLCYDDSDLFSGPSFSGSGDCLDLWNTPWLAQGPGFSIPQLRGTLLPSLTLGSDPLSQCVSSADSLTLEPAFGVDLSPSEWRYVGLAENLLIQDPKGAGLSYGKEGATLFKLSPITSPDCVCDDESWLRQCPQLWDHHQSALVSTSTDCTCPYGVPSHVVPRSCPAAAMHLVAMVQENDRMVADIFQNAAQRKPDDNPPNSSPTPINPFSPAPPGPTAGPEGEPLNPCSSSTEGQNIASSDIQPPSPNPRPPAHPSIQRHDHALSVLPTPLSIMRERRQPKITRKGDLNIEISLRAALPSSHTQLTLPTPGDPIVPRHSRKRRVSDDPAIPNVAKKQKTEPLPESPEGLFYHKLGPKLQIRQRSDWQGMPSIGDQKHKRGKGKKRVKRKRNGEGKRKGSGMSNDLPKEIIEATPCMDKVDKDYLDGALETLKSASFRQLPQQMECTIGKDGACDLDVVRPPRSTGIGQVQEGDSAYFIFLSQIEDGFLCWICGHIMTVEKQLRALGHVRMHFEHRPFHCNWEINGEKGEKIPCGCGKSWAFEEAMRDEHQKRSTHHKCPYCRMPTLFSTPSNLARHIRETHPVM